MRRKKNIRLNKKQSIFLLLTLCFFVGFVIGIISVNTMEKSLISSVSSNLESYLQQFPSADHTQMEIFRNSVFKYLKFVFIVWFLAFVPIGGFVILFLVLLRGASYGFTSALLYKQLGLSEFFSSILLYIPQALVVIPSFLYMASRSIQYIMFHIHNKKNLAYSTSLSDYVSSLLLGIIFAIMAGFLDAFVVPEIISKLI